MQIAEIIAHLESVAHPSLQEEYDNCGLITGNSSATCTGVLCTLDVTEEVIREAIGRKCNLVVAHHPLIFRGLKKINGKNDTERTLILAIKKDVAVYAIHTNLDNIPAGVNGKMAGLLGLINTRVLAPKPGMLKKLYSFVPAEHAEKVRNALFAAGAGHIGRYSECSFNAAGTGTFTAGEGTNPFVGKAGQRHEENEIKIETVFPAWLEPGLIRALQEAHPYEEVAFDVVNLANTPGISGSGLIGELPVPMDELTFLGLLKEVFGTPVIRHSRLLNRPVKRVALCGSAGSFLITNALAERADFYISSDMKYHEFFEAGNRLVLADIGHYESEQFTTDLLADVLAEKFPTFAILKTGIKTNPVHYF